MLLREDAERALGVGEVGRDGCGDLVEAGGRDDDDTEGFCGEELRSDESRWAHNGTGGTAGTGGACALADLERRRGWRTASLGGDGSSGPVPVLGKLILDSTAPRERLRRFLESPSSTGAGSSMTVVE